MFGMHCIRSKSDSGNSDLNHQLSYSIRRLRFLPKHKALDCCGNGQAQDSDRGTKICTALLVWRVEWKVESVECGVWSVK